MSDAMDQFAEALAQAAFEKLTVKVRGFFESLAVEKPADKVLTVKKIAERLGISATKAGELVRGGYIKQAPGYIETCALRSAVDAYGK